MTISGQLFEQGKLQIKDEVKIYDRSWTLIGKIMNRNPNAIISFNDSYLKKEAIPPKRGRQKEIDLCIKYGAIGSVQAYLLQKLQDISNDFEISTTSAKTIFYSNQIKFFQQTPVTPLTPIHEQERVKFTEQFIGKNYLKIYQTSSSLMNVW